MTHKIFSSLFLVFSLISCSEQTLNPEKVYLSKEFKSYWFDGKAEISTYILSQSRYGEMRSGNVVLIFVTEDFLKKEQVKANISSEKSESILKLNRIVNFLTGIYPYHIMNSSFVSVEETEPLRKITVSIQEWCGQTYLQLNKKSELKIKRHSYFEGETDQELNFKNALTEEELWSTIRINPSSLPIGNLNIIPSLDLLQLNHLRIKPYQAIAKLDFKNNYFTYSLEFQDLNRLLKIKFKNSFPNQIEGWEEFSLKENIQLSSANRLTTKKISYWQNNKLGDEKYRDSLLLNP